MPTPSRAKVQTSRRGKPEPGFFRPPAPVGWRGRARNLFFSIHRSVIPPALYFCVGIVLPMSLNSPSALSGISKA